MWTLSGLRTILLLQFIPAGTPRRSLMDPASKTPYTSVRTALRPAIAKKDLPPLPDIKDGNIRLQVFTHRSFYARQTRLFEDHPGMDGRYMTRAWTTRCWNTWETLSSAWSSQTSCETRFPTSEWDPARYLRTPCHSVVALHSPISR